MKAPTPEEKTRARICHIIMVDDESDVNITIKTALEENGEFQVDMRSTKLIMSLI
jgi:hypothetical protein